MIDRIRSEIQDRLDQLLSEAEKLRRALNALDPRDSSSAAASSSQPATTVRGDRSSAKSASPSSARAPRARTAPGETKRAVLAALDSEKGLTAGEVAAATGLARATVSTTLSKLATSGEILKVQRGYQLAGHGTAAAVK